MSASTRIAMPKGLERGSPRSGGRHLAWRMMQRARKTIPGAPSNYPAHPVAKDILIKDIVKDTLWILSFNRLIYRKCSVVSLLLLKGGAMKLILIQGSQTGERSRQEPSTERMTWIDKMLEKVYKWLSSSGMNESSRVPLQVALWASVRLGALHGKYGMP